MKSTISTSILAALAIATGMLINAAPVAGGEGDRANIIIIPMGYLHHGNVDSGDSSASTVSLGYEHDPGGGLGAEIFFSTVYSGSADGMIYGANLSLIAPHGPHPLMRGRLLFGMVYNDKTNEYYNEHLGWQTGVRMELGRQVFTPLVVEVLYRWLKVDWDSGVESYTDDLSGLVFNVGFGFRFP